MQILVDESANRIILRALVGNSLCTTNSTNSNQIVPPQSLSELYTDRHNKKRAGFFRAISKSNQQSPLVSPS